jgi:hypothetical protein
MNGIVETRTLQLISQIRKFGEKNASCKDAAKAMGPSGQCGARPLSYVLHRKTTVYNITPVHVQVAEDPRVLYVY